MWHIKSKRTAPCRKTDAQKARSIIRRFENLGINYSHQEYKIYEYVPREAVKLVQWHVIGFVYVSAKTTQAESCAYE